METLSAPRTRFFQELHAGLRTKGRWHADHPFIKALADGKVGRAQLKRWIIEMYIRVEKAVPRKWARPALAQMPAEPRRPPHRSARIPMSNRSPPEAGAFSSSAMRRRVRGFGRID